MFDDEEYYDIAKRNRSFNINPLSVANAKASLQENYEKENHSRNVENE
jgi:hypothetical protein